MLSSKTQQPTNFMQTEDRIPISIIGGTGYVGRLLIRRLLTHPLFCIGKVVGSPRSVGSILQSVWESKESALAQNYEGLWTPLSFPPELKRCVVSSADDIPDGSYAISCLAPDVADVEESLLARGVVLISVCPKNRTGNMFVMENNRETFKSEVLVDRRLFKSPNCVVCGTSIAIEALRQRFGLEALCVTTMQSISGRGDAMYGGKRIVNNVMPINMIENTEQYIRNELKELFGISHVSVRAYRIGVHIGHTIDVRARLTTRDVCKKDVIEAFEQFAPLADSTSYSPSTPRYPIVVCHEGGGPQPRQRTHLIHPCSICDGMQISVGNIDTNQHGWSVSFTLVIHNLIRGAYGAALQMLEHYVQLQDTGITPVACVSRKGPQ